MNSREFILDLHYMAYNQFSSFWKIDQRVLSDYELIYIISGSGFITLEHRKVPFEAGDFILIPPNISHAMHSDQLPLTLWCVHFKAFTQTTGTTAPHYSDIPGSYINGLFFPKWDAQGGYPKYQSCQIQMELVSHSRSSLVSSLAFKIHQLMLGNIADNIPEIRSLLAEILESSIVADGMDDQQPAGQIKKYIETHYAEKITLSQLSGSCHLEPSYISALFKKKYGITITEYISRCRITAVKSYLTYTEETLEGIAEKTGFFDASHLCRIFLSSEGISPAKFRVLTRASHRIT